MFADVATPQVTRQPNFYGRAMPALCAIGEMATLLDSVYDVRQDVRDGKQALRPSVEYYARLSGAAAARMKLGGKAVLHFEPLNILLFNGACGRRIECKMVFLRTRHCGGSNGVYNK